MRRSIVTLAVLAGCANGSADPGLTDFAIGAGSGPRGPALTRAALPDDFLLDSTFVEGTSFDDLWLEGNPGPYAADHIAQVTGGPEALHWDGRAWSAVTGFGNDLGMRLRASGRDEVWYWRGVHAPFGHFDASGAVVGPITDPGVLWSVDAAFGDVAVITTLRSPSADHGTYSLVDGDVITPLPDLGGADDWGRMWAPDLAIVPAMPRSSEDSTYALWDGETLALLPSDGSDQVRSARPFAPSFPADDIVASPIEPWDDYDDVLHTARFDGVSWSAFDMSVPTGPDGLPLSEVQFVHTAGHDLVAIGVAYPSADAPDAAEHVWGMAWNGSRWADARDLGAIPWQAACLPRCPGQQLLLPRSLWDGSVVLPWRDPDDHAVYIARYE